MASMVPLAILLGPMMMTFFWLPPRIAPAAWNAPPGSDVSLVATLDSSLRQPVTLIIPPPLELDPVTAATRTLPPIRETLEKLVAQRQNPSDLTTQPWELQEAGRRAREQMLRDLQSYLAAGVPPQSLEWKVRTPHVSGSFPVTLAIPGQPPTTINIILGDRYPSRPAELLGDGPVRSLKVVYPPPEKKPIFWAPLKWLGKSWDAGWLGVYMVVYLPVMFTMKWLLGVV
jgi:hypothetical protein